MHRLFLLRHAKAAWAQPGMGDFDRPLDPAGKKSLPGLAAALIANHHLPDLVIISAARRTQETAFGLLNLLPNRIASEVDEEIYSGGAADYLKSIQRHGHVKNLMLVGHNPSIEDLTLALCQTGDPDSLDRLRAGFPTSGLAIIRHETAFSEMVPGSGYLESFPAP